MTLSLSRISQKLIVELEHDIQHSDSETGTQTFHEQLVDNSVRRHNISLTFFCAAIVDWGRKSSLYRLSYKCDVNRIVMKPGIPDYTHRYTS